MKNKPNMKILLEGRTDKRGSAKKNQKLSEDRVESTKKYLTEQDVDGSRIATQGWGHQKRLIIIYDIEKG